MMSSLDRVHLKSDGSIFNGIREQTLILFNLIGPPRNKIIEKPITVLFEKINKTRFDRIEFSSKTLTITQ